jgi:hypothetical protein
VLCFCFVCLRLVYPLLLVSLDCQYMIVHSVFSNVYLCNTMIMCLFLMIHSTFWSFLSRDLYLSTRERIGKKDITEWTIIYWQSRETNNKGYTRRRQTKQKHNTIRVGHHYTQAITNNVFWVVIYIYLQENELVKKTYATFFLIYYINCTIY